jgi:hypothetical protein
LTDLNDDGVADERQLMVSKFGYTGNAADVHGCFLGPDGRIYWCEGRHGHEITDKDGQLVSKGKAARVFSCKTDGSDVQVFAGGGMDNPVEVDWTEEGEMLGTAWALVGLTHGDDSMPGIGTMPLTQITSDMRTTPAGRFVASLGHVLGKLNVLWVDYPNAVSLHRVINTNPAERRLERIVSKVPAEHRISFGCINVPAQFFDSVVDPAFRDTHGIVYILPEVKQMHAVFPAYYDIDDPGKAQAALN